MTLSSSAQLRWSPASPVALLFGLSALLGGCAEGIGGTSLETLAEQPAVSEVGQQSPASSQSSTATFNGAANNWLGPAETAGAAGTMGTMGTTSMDSTVLQGPPASGAAPTAGATGSTDTASGSAGVDDGDVVDAGGLPLTNSNATSAGDDSSAIPASTNPASTNPASTSPASTSPASTTPASSTPAEATCDDGLRNGDESDVDCGGACEPCAASATCRTDNDCDVELNCSAGRCTQPEPRAEDQPSAASSSSGQADVEMPPSMDSGPTCGGDSCGRCALGREPCCTILNRCGCALLGDLICLPSLFP